MFIIYKLKRERERGPGYQEMLIHLVHRSGGGSGGDKQSGRQKEDERGGVWGILSPSFPCVMPCNTDPEGYTLEGKKENGGGGTV